MQGVLIDDHRIHVDFSQSVRRVQYPVLAVQLIFLIRSPSYRIHGEQQQIQKERADMVDSAAYRVSKRNGSTGLLMLEGRDHRGMEWSSTEMTFEKREIESLISRLNPGTVLGVVVQGENTVACAAHPLNVERDEVTEEAVTMVGKRTLFDGDDETLYWMILLIPDQSDTKISPWNVILKWTVTVFRQYAMLVKLCESGIQMIRFSRQHSISKTLLQKSFPTKYSSHALVLDSDLKYKLKLKLILNRKRGAVINCVMWKTVITHFARHSL